MDEQWHLSKSIPISIIVFLAIQTAGVLIWAVRLDSRVQHLEESQSLQDMRLARADDINARIAIIEERQKNVLARLDIQTKTMQEILAIVNSATLKPKP